MTLSPAVLAAKARALNYSLHCTSEQWELLIQAEDAGLLTSQAIAQGQDTLACLLARRAARYARGGWPWLRGE